MNTIKKYPEIGDIMIKVGDDIRFLGQDATPEFIETQQAIGVVYYVNGNHVKIVGGDNGNLEQWSCVSDYEIETIPEATGDYAVTLQGKSVGNFHYDRVAGTKEEFVQQLNAWLPSVNNKYEAYMHNGVAVLQMSQYDSYSNTNTIAGCKLRKRIGEEVAAYDAGAPLTQTGQSKWYSGINYQRLLEFARNNTDKNCNPTTRVNAKDLFQTFPVSESYYNGELGDLLRAACPTYESYIKACMVQPWAFKQCTLERDGRRFTELMAKKTVLVRGVEKPAYPALARAVNYDSGVDGFRKGDWWMPCMHEMILLMSVITRGTKLPLDAINRSLAKKKGWSGISAAGGRWSSSRFSAGYAWFFYCAGFADASYCCFRLYASAVSAFNLKF